MIWDYDVMMHGTWDSNACNVLNDNAINEISRLISKLEYGKVLIKMDMI